MSKMIMIDGNTAAAMVAHATNEVCAIYPITPSSNMGETADELSAAGVKNIWGTIPDVAELQSEGGASGELTGSALVFRDLDLTVPTGQPVSMCLAVSVDAGEHWGSTAGFRLEGPASADVAPGDALVLVTRGDALQGLSAEEGLRPRVPVRSFARRRPSARYCFSSDVPR